MPTEVVEKSKDKMVQLEVVNGKVKLITMKQYILYILVAFTTYSCKAEGGYTKILKNINLEKYSEGAEEMRDVTNGGTSGLVKRRNAEINMFKSNIYDSTH